MREQILDSAQGEDNNDLLLPRAKRQAAIDAVDEP
jgi:hypothetical protein